MTEDSPVDRIQHPMDSHRTERYDCFICNKEDCRGWTMPTTQQWQCGECLRHIQVGETMIRCTARNDDDPSGMRIPCTWFDNTNVCVDCVRKGRLQRKNSRWHDSEPEWKSTLFGCDGLPGLTAASLLCYYNPLGAPPCTSLEATLRPFRGRERANKECPFPVCIVKEGGSPDHCWAITLIPAMPLYFALDMIVQPQLLCYNGYRYQERRVLARFGIKEEHSCPVYFFCRWCHFMRLRREMELRGYRQPHFCGPSFAERMADYPSPPGVSQMSAVGPVDGPGDESRSRLPYAW